MKLQRTLAPALMLGALLASLPATAGTITGSAHDFTSSSWSGGRICVACHTPHKSDTSVADAPLWNHASTTASYTLYSSPTLKATITQPGGSSKLCLSCHDGTVAVNSFGGVTGTTMISTASNLGTNLKSSHPIGFTYDTTLSSQNGSLHDPATKVVTIGSGTQTKTGTIGSVLLYGGKLECGSCHDVHNTFTVGGSGTGLVKVDPSGSKICLSCHDK
ncbi:MAG: cytochrome C [Pseudomonadota bacterium]